MTGDQVASFDRDGFFVLDRAIEADTLAKLVAQLADGVAAVEEFLTKVPGGRLSVAGRDTQIVAPHQVLRSRWVAEFCRSPLLAGICRDLVGPQVRLYWDQAVYKTPASAEPVLYHQDNGYTFVVPQAYLTCWIALTDATPDNGCVKAIPGIHRHGTLAHRETPIGMECDIDERAAVELPVRAGSIVIFSSLTPHATGLNRTDEARRAYIVQYARDGAVAFRGDADGGPGPAQPQNDPGRQFMVTS